MKSPFSKPAGNVPRMSQLGAGSEIPTGAGILDRFISQLTFMLAIVIGIYIYNYISIYIYISLVYIYTYQPFVLLLAGKPRLAMQNSMVFSYVFIFIKLLPWGYFRFAGTKSCVYCIQSLWIQTLSEKVRLTP
jgi:hypothetical protein